MKKLVVLLLAVPSCIQAVSGGTPPKGGGGLFVVGPNDIPQRVEIPPQLAPIAAGSVDRSFGENGYVRGTPLETGSSYFAMVKDGSGNLYVCGYATTGVHQWVVAKYTSSGELDTSFNSVGYVQETGIGASEAHGLALTGSNIVVVGFSTVSATSTWTVIEYNATTGAKVTAFGPNGTGIIQEDELGAGVAYSVSVASDNTLYVGGYTTPTSATVITTISYTSDGLRNAAYNP